MSGDLTIDGNNNDFLQNWLEKRYGADAASEMMQDIRADLDAAQLQESAHNLLKKLEGLEPMNDNFCFYHTSTQNFYTMIFDQI